MCLSTLETRVDYPKVHQVLLACHNAPYDGHFGGTKIAAKVLQSGYFWTYILKDANEIIKTFYIFQRIGNISMRKEMALTHILEIELSDVLDIDFMGPFPQSFVN